MKYTIVPSDIMGALSVQWTLKQTVEQADWLIGANIFTDKVAGVALRSLKAPGSAFDDPIIGKDPQVAHFSQYVRTEEDYGGVHLNSGIPNHAFYLASQRLGGYAWEHTGQIWYKTLCDKRLKSEFGFKRFARLTVENAGQLFGENGDQQKAVIGAWESVGVLLSESDG